MVDNNKLNDPSRSPLGGHPQPGPDRLHPDLQADPELAKGPASSGRIVAFGAAIVVVLGIVFYGLNNTAQVPDPTTAATQTTPAASPSLNKDSGTTTGAAPANPQQPKSGPTGTEVDRSRGGDNPAAK